MSKGTFHGHLKKTLSDLFLNTTYLNIEFITDEIKKHLRLYCDSITIGKKEENNGIVCVPIVFDFGDLQSEFIFCFRKTKEKAQEPEIKTEIDDTPQKKSLWHRKPKTKPIKVINVKPTHQPEERWRLVSID